MRQTKAELEKKFENLQEEIKSYSEINAELNDKVGVLMSEAEARHHKYQELTLKIQSLEVEKEELQSEIDKTTSVFTILNEVVDTKNARIESLFDDKNDLRKDLMKATRIKHRLEYDISVIKRTKFILIFFVIILSLGLFLKLI